MITDIFPPKTGGSGRWFWELYRRFPRADYLVAAGEDPRQAEFDGKHDLPVVRLPLNLPNWGLLSRSGLKGYARAFLALRRIVRRYRPLSVHAGRVQPEGVMAWLLKRWFGLPYLCYVHGEEINLTSLSRENRWLARRVLAGADLVIANSRNSSKVVRNFAGRRCGETAVLHPGVDTERFRPAPRDPATRARFGWADRPVILTVGRLQRRKGHDHLIRALARVRKSIPDVLYAIIGDGEERPRLEEITAREGLSSHVQFLGERSDGDLIKAYQQCDLFVLPNRQFGHDFEGFGMVLLEAQACGKPVIAGASGGTAETMNIPATGRVVDCSTPEPLVPLLTEWLSDRDGLEKMGAAARAWAVERFDWSVLAGQARSLMERVSSHGIRRSVRASGRARAACQFPVPMTSNAESRKRIKAPEYPP